MLVSFVLLFVVLCEKNIKMGNTISTMMQKIRKRPKLLLTDLPNEVLFHIVSYLSKEDLFWTIGVTCQQLFEICCIFNDNTIVLSGNEKQYIRSLKHLAKQQEIVLSVRQLVVWWYPEDYIGLNQSLHQNFTRFTRYKKEICIEKPPPISSNSGITLICKTDAGKHLLQSMIFYHRQYLFDILRFVRRCANLEGIFWKDTQAFGNFNSSRKRPQKIPTKNISSVGTKDLSELFRTTKDLKYLTLSNFHDTDLNYTELTKNWGQLRSLDLTLSNDVTNEVISEIFTNCKYLKYLDLSLNLKLTDPGAISIGAMTRLEGLVLSGCTRISNNGIATILIALESLKYLDLSFCNGVTDTCLETTSNHLRSLTCLVLNHCQDITDIGIVHLSSLCTGLKAIEVEDCKKLSDESMISISTYCKSLDILNVNCISNITDQGIISICNGCLDIKVFELENMNRITDTGFRAISSKCKEIIALNLNCCPQLNDETLKDVVLNCRKLKILDIRWKCSGLTELGIQSAVENNLYLKKIYQDGRRPGETVLFENSYRNIKHNVFQSIDPYLKCFPR